jgi:hypothetical protein
MHDERWHVAACLCKTCLIGVDDEVKGLVNVTCEERKSVRISLRVAPSSYRKGDDRWVKSRCASGF